MKHAIVPILLLLAVGLIVGCGPSDSQSARNDTTPEEPTPAAPPAASRLFQVRGTVEEVPETGTTVRIKHEAIPNYMQAMTMPFTVKDRTELDGIQEGDTISFTLHVAATESWITSLARVTPKAISAPGEMPSAGSFRRVRHVEPLSEGDLMPNYPFVNQRDEAVNLDDFRGKVLVFTFIYTRCPMPDFCPRMNLNFRSAYESLKSDEGAPQNWHFLSITFDPKFDTPKVLLNYSKAYAGDTTQWSFLTGEQIEIDAITEQFGLVYSLIEGSVTDWDHNLRTVIVDPDGHIYKIYIGNAWKPETLIDDIKQAALPPNERTPTDEE